MISLDIESLFTNVPVSETIDIILRQLYPQDNVIYQGFSKSDFHNLLKLAVEDSYFSFNNKLYRQIDGMSMGSPLGPLFANIFLSYYESEWIQNCPVKPLFYRRYVDDTLWLLPIDSDVSVLMNYMNTRHSNMRFTYESESNDCIHFIGLTITHLTENNRHKYLTSVYRKPTSTSLFMNFNSFVPLMYRLSVFKCLVSRAIQLCSTWNLFHVEIDNVRSMLLRNAYPSFLLDRIVKNAVSSFLNPNVKFGPQKERLYIGLPFLGKSTDSLRKSIKEICNQFIPNKDIIIYFKPGRRVSNFFRVKDITPFELRSRVVYEFSCVGCQANYVGQTTRHLRHRIAEHEGVSHLTGKVMKSQSHSSIRDHSLLCNGCNCSTSNFKILSTGKSDLELLIKERLLIKDRKPSLNGNVGSFELFLN
jgi:hypothetical protein